jgi:hypothetical protein
VNRNTLLGQSGQLRFVAGLIILAILSAGIVGPTLCEAGQNSAASASSEPEPNSPPKAQKVSPTKIIDLGKNDHIALLKLAVDRYRTTVRDYTGIFHKQERIGRKIGKGQIISFKFKEKPYSVFMQWKKNARGAHRLLYVEGQNKNKMVVRPTGLASIFGSVKLDPNSKEALSSSLQPCHRFGFHRTMTAILKVYELAKKNGDLETRFLGLTNIDKRKCVKLERILPRKKQYEYGRLTMEFDLEYLLPVSVTSYDWQGRLVGRYVFTNLKLNVGLTDKQFTRKANKL